MRIFIMGPVETFEDRTIAIMEIVRWWNDLIESLETEE